MLDGRLTGTEYLAGQEYSIADIAHFGWIWRRAFAGIDFQDAPQVERWSRQVEGRPAVVRAIARLSA